jgi:NADP-dependent 3-hydroxy acid dehydrogenase YdfG
MGQLESKVAIVTGACSGCGEGTARLFAAEGAGALVDACVYAVNVKSTFRMAHAVVPPMRERKGGVIINIGSTAGIRPRPGLT